MFTRLQSKHIFLTKYGILILKITKILARNAKNKYKNSFISIFIPYFATDKH